MKKGIATTLVILGMIFIILGTTGAFGQLQLGDFTWVALILGVIFFPSGIGLMKTTKSSS